MPHDPILQQKFSEDSPHDELTRLAGVLMAQIVQHMPDDVRVIVVIERPNPSGEGGESGIGASGFESRDQLFESLFRNALGTQSPETRVEILKLLEEETH